MKYKLFSFILIFNLLLCFSQNGKVTYNITIPEGFANDSELAKKVLKELPLMSYNLNYTKNASYFKKNKHIPIEKYPSVLANILAGSDKNYFQYQKNRETLVNTEIKNNIYKVNYSFKMKDWELTQETKKIDNYTCYKAVLTEYNDRSDSYFKTIAWYTPEIPVPFGPTGYGALPGLILQLNYKGSVFTANKIILNSKKEPKIPVIKEGKKITVAEMVTLMRKARKVTPD